MKSFAAAFVLTLVAMPVLADEPDGLVLPSGFHATVVADGLTGARHLAVRDNGDIYVSTAHGPQVPSMGIYALRLGPDHKAVQTEHFGSVDQGTGIRFYKGALYAASGTGVDRITFSGNELVPTAAPEVIVDGLTGGSHGIAFDGKGNLFVSISGGGGDNNCSDPNAPSRRSRSVSVTHATAPQVLPDRGKSGRQRAVHPVSPACYDPDRECPVTQVNQ